MQTPKDYFEQVVQKNYEEFENNCDICNCINFAMTAYHLHEWIFHFHKDSPEKVFGTKNEKKYSKVLSDKYEEFRLLREITLLYKHCERDPRTKPLVPDNTGITYYDGFRCGVDHCGMPIGGIQRLDINGVSFHQIFFGVMKMWYELFKECDL